MRKNYRTYDVFSREDLAVRIEFVLMVPEIAGKMLQMATKSRAGDGQR
jgi:hypothetical protein